MSIPGLKQSIYLPDHQLREIEEEAARLDRSLSWVVMVAWRIARAQVRAFPDSPLPAGPRRTPTRRRAGVARAKRIAQTPPPPERTPKPLARRLGELADQRRQLRRAAAASPPSTPPAPPPMQDQPPHAGTPVSRAWEAHLQDQRGTP